MFRGLPGLLPLHGWLNGDLKAKPKYRRRKNGRQLPFPTLPFPDKRIIETAAVNLKPLALSLSKGEQAYGLRQAQPERLFQEQRGRLNKTQNPPQRRGDAEEHREADPIKSLQNLPLPQKILHFLCVVSAPLCLCGGF